MKFLTEDDLRIAYQKSPFETFTVNKDCRLTPGARTFLIDRKIKILNEDDSKSVVAKKYGNCVGSPKFQNLENTNCQSNDVWLDIRCELLQTAVDLAHIDIDLANELSAQERFLATILVGGQSELPPFGGLGEEPIDKSFIYGNLSNVGLFLQKSNGKILVKLFPLYLHLDRQLETIKSLETSKILKLLERLGQLIAYYLQKREDFNNEIN